jgi:hypothetical protein
MIFLEQKIGFKRNYLKKDRGKPVVRLGWCIGKKMDPNTGSVREGEMR